MSSRAAIELEQLERGSDLVTLSGYGKRTVILPRKEAEYIVEVARKQTARAKKGLLYPRRYRPVEKRVAPSPYRAPHPELERTQVREVGAPQTQIIMRPRPKGEKGFKFVMGTYPTKGATRQLLDIGKAIARKEKLKPIYAEPFRPVEIARRPTIAEPIYVGAGFLSSFEGIVQRDVPTVWQPKKLKEFSAKYPGYGKGVVLGEVAQFYVSGKLFEKVIMPAWKKVVVPSRLYHKIRYSRLVMSAEMRMHGWAWKKFGVKAWGYRPPKSLTWHQIFHPHKALPTVGRGYEGFYYAPVRYDVTYPKVSIMVEDIFLRPGKAYVQPLVSKRVSQWARSKWIKGPPSQMPVSRTYLGRKTTTPFETSLRKAMEAPTRKVVGGRMVLLQEARLSVRESKALQLLQPPKIVAKTATKALVKTVPKTSVVKPLLAFSIPSLVKWKGPTYPSVTKAYKLKEYPILVPKKREKRKGLLVLKLKPRLKEKLELKPVQIQKPKQLSKSIQKQLQKQKQVARTQLVPKLKVPTYQPTIQKMVPPIKPPVSWPRIRPSRAKKIREDLLGRWFKRMHPIATEKQVKKLVFG